MVSRDLQDQVEIVSVDRLFYWGPMTPLLEGWFDRWAYRQPQFYAVARFDGIALGLLSHATHADWSRSLERCA